MRGLGQPRRGGVLEDQRAAGGQLSVCRRQEADGAYPRSRLAGGRVPGIVAGEPGNTHMTEITRAQLHAYLEDTLNDQETARVEQALRDSEPLRRALRALIQDRDRGEHSIGAIWQRQRLELSQPRSARQLPASGARLGLARLHRLPSSHHRLPILPGEHDRSAIAPARARGANSETPAALFRLQPRLPARRGRHAETSLRSPELTVDRFGCASYIDWV